MIDVEKGSPSPSVTGARAAGARERPAGGGEGTGRVQRGPLVGWGEGGGVRELAECAGAARQRLRQLARRHPPLASWF